MSYVVTGATGNLGRLAVEALLERGTRPEQVVAAGRSTDKLKELANWGVQTRAIDYDDPESLRTAFDGAQRVLFVSGSELGKRTRQHANVIDAARRVSVELLAYTSIANADTTSIKLAREHQETEAALRASGLPFALLRNSWYLENYTAQLPMYLEQGAIVGSAGEGRVSAATRADYAAGAAAVLTGDPEPGQIYELGGDEPFTLGQLAVEISAQTGQPVEYRNLPVDEYAKILVSAGLPEPVADIVADSDRGLAAGDLLVDSGDLGRLIGRRPTTMSEAVAATLA